MSRDTLNEEDRKGRAEERRQKEYDFRSLASLCHGSRSGWEDAGSELRIRAEKRTGRSTGEHQRAR